MQTEALLGATIYAVDTGINEVWKVYGEQLGLADGLGVDFGTKWYIPLRLEQKGGLNEEWETE